VEFVSAAETELGVITASLLVDIESVVIEDFEKI